MCSLFFKQDSLLDLFSSPVPLHMVFVKAELWQHLKSKLVSHCVPENGQGKKQAQKQPRKTKAKAPLCACCHQKAREVM